MKWFKYTLLVTIICFLALGLSLVYYAKKPLRLIPQAQEITITPHSSLTKIANQLVEQGVIKHALPFILLVRVLHKEASLQAGDYTLNKNINPYNLMLSLNHGKTTQGSVTFIEGKNFKQVREKLSKNDAIKNTIANLSDAKIMSIIDPSNSQPEGLFFPDTYYFDRGTTDINILKRAYDIMQTKLKAAWQVRVSNLPYKTPYEALIMASIVEKETGKASERPMIAGVFINRLRIGMRLQTDPSVIYGMGDSYDGNIRRKDLEKDTIYNTYTREGLPPTPIGMPSMASIQAALHPNITKALYFVGKGDGSHQFSNTLAEHNRAVAEYQLKPTITK